MVGTQKMELIEKILKSCLFSEYLPLEFSTELLTKNELSVTKENLLPPITFSMDKFNDIENRRFISIPEVTSFIGAVQSLSAGNILDQIIQLNKNDKHSLSNILNVKHEIMQFSNKYGFAVISQKEISSENSDHNFLGNLKLKLEKSKSCKYIMHLDIANFYNNIYTHNISAITKGEEWANEQYHLTRKSERLDEYKHLNTIDSKIASMNLRRTHGLLIGPRLSFIIAEGLLTRIDFELEQELSQHDIDFVRYVDDYDVFIKKEEQIKIVQNTFNNILQKYGLLINDSKTKLEEFPFYTYLDYETLIKNTSDLSNIYAKFGQIEKNKIQNGALLYFCENILSKYTNSDLALSLSFSILKNISKALVSSCKNIAKFKITDSDKNEIYKLLIDILEEFSAEEYDLETIWVLYTLLKLCPEFSLSESPLNSKINEVALIVYIYESQNGMQDEFIKNRAKECGWLLNYELYFNNVIAENEIKSNLNITDISSYEQLKKKGIHFYIKKS